MLGELRLIVGPQSGLRWMRLTSRACAHEKPCVLLRGRESLMMSTLKKNLNLFFFFRSRIRRWARTPGGKSFVGAQL